MSQRQHSALWIASRGGHTEVVQILLSHPNIIIDQPDLFGVAPLWSACNKGHSEVVELLLNPPNIQKKIKLFKKGQYKNQKYK